MQGKFAGQRIIENYIVHLFDTANRDNAFLFALGKAVLHFY
jgi:hypothetical protein